MECTPSLTRAPLLSPDSQMRIRLCWAVHHPPSASSHGGRKDLGGGHVRSPAPICSACRAGLPSARSTVGSAAGRLPPCLHTFVRRLAQNNGFKVNDECGEHGRSCRKQRAYLFRYNGTKRSAEDRLQLRTDKFVCRGKVVSEHHLANSSAAACDVRRGWMGTSASAADVPFIRSFDEHARVGRKRLTFPKCW